MRGRAVKLQIALTAGRAKTSAVLRDSTRRARKQPRLTATEESPNMLSLHSLCSTGLQVIQYTCSCADALKWNTKANELCQVEPRLNHLRVRVWDVAMCAGPDCTCFSRDKPSAAWVEDLKDSLVLHIIFWPKSTPPRERERAIKRETASQYQADLSIATYVETQIYFRAGAWHST